jgi:hypothetical protein
MDNFDKIEDFFKTIYSTDPAPLKSINFQIDVIDNDTPVDTQLSDIFELLLNMLIYGIKYLNLSFETTDILLLKRYFNSIGIDFLIEIEPFDTNLFKDSRYVTRYCTIDPVVYCFIMNVNKFPKTKLNEWVATYQLEYESLIFIRFNYI